MSRRRWIALPGIVALLAVATWWLLTPRKPSRPFAQTPPPAAPDYAQRSAWFARADVPGLERSTPPGRTPNPAPLVDVFFIAPTTYLGNDRWNAGIDVAGTYDDVVMLNQASAFNACCRIFAPRYRQASLYALGNERPAVDLAYAGVERAFRWYLDHDNQGRSFLIASHSQGSGHASRLLQPVAATARRRPRPRRVRVLRLSGDRPPDLRRAGSDRGASCPGMPVRTGGAVPNA